LCELEVRRLIKGKPRSEVMKGVPWLAQPMKVLELAVALPYGCIVIPLVLYVNCDISHFVVRAHSPLPVRGPGGSLVN
jgi:hypothetical protein